MHIGNNIKKYRNKFKISQEELALNIFVSRQTISNWENNKCYPDINSLVLLSRVFNISVDELIKEDENMIKEITNSHEISKFNKLSLAYSIMFTAMIISPILLFHFLKYIGLIIWIIIICINFYLAFKIENIKKTYNIQTIKEINAFLNGKKLDEISKAKEEGKKIYQKIFIVLAIAIITTIINIILIKII